MTTTLRGMVKGNHSITFPFALGHEVSIRAENIIEWDVVGAQSATVEAVDGSNEQVRGVLRASFPDWKAVEAFIEAEREAWEDSEE